jgi:hypothetical protein
MARNLNHQVANVVLSLPCCVMSTMVAFVAIFITVAGVTGLAFSILLGVDWNMGCALGMVAWFGVYVIVGLIIEVVKARSH